MPLSYSLKYPFDFNPNSSGWAVLDSEKKIEYSVNLYELLLTIYKVVPSNIVDGLVITSAWRSLENNRKIGSKDTSKHLVGKAFDFRFNKASHDLYELYNQKNSSVYYELYILKENNHYHVTRRD